MSLSHGSPASTNSLAVPHTQNTAPVLEFRCLFTADLKRKQKRWQDGKLKFHTHNNRVMVYDEKSNFVGDSHWREDYPLGEGEELDLERGGIMVEVGECVGKTQQDLTELVDKRIKDKENRAAAKAAKGTPMRTPAAPMRCEESPGLYPQHKSLSTMLTPSGHYGRAVMPTTSPFEDRQRLDRGKADGKENERPAKRQKTNDASSKNGYAQNLMGATLSLSSSRPPSSAPIRYEPMKLKSVSRPEPVDLTLDDDVDRSYARQQGNDEGRKEKQGHRESVIQKRRRKLPPPKSTYAGNLTGTSLNLSMPPIRRDVGLPKPRPVKSSRPIELDNSSSEEKSGNGRRPQEQASNASRMLSSKSKAPKRDAVPMELLEDNVELPRKAAPNKHINVAQVSKHRRISLPFVDSESESDTDRHVSQEVMIPSKTTKGKKMPREDITPMANSEETIQPRKKARTKSANKDSRPSRRDSLPLSTSSSRILPEPKIQVSRPSNVVSNSVTRCPSVAERHHDVKVSSLRIKSKPPRRMMMHVDRSSTRTPGNSSVTQAVSNPSEYLTDEASQIVMSQDTMQLNAFYQKQEAKLQARLAGKKQVNREPQISSPASTDNGINHQTIDLLLSRKSVQIIRNEAATKPTPKPARREDSSPPSVTANAASKPRSRFVPNHVIDDSNSHSSPPAFEVAQIPRKPAKQLDPLPAQEHAKAATNSKPVSATIPATCEPETDSSTSASDVAEAVRKEATRQMDLTPALALANNVSPSGAVSATIPAPTNNSAISSSPAFESSKMVPRANESSAPVAISPTIPATNDPVMSSPPSPPNESHLGVLARESSDPRENTSDGETSSIPVAKHPLYKNYSQARPVVQEAHVSGNTTGPGHAPSISGCESRDGKLATQILPSKTKSVPVQRFRKDLDSQSSGGRSPESASHKPSSVPADTRLPSVILSTEPSQSPEQSAFLPPELSSAIQFATAHFQSIIKSPTIAVIAAKPPMPELTPEAEIHKLQPMVDATISREAKIVKPAPESSPSLQNEFQQKPGQATLEEAELTPVIRMTDIPTAPSSLITLQPIPKFKVANPATTKGKGRSLSELAASTMNANEIHTPSSLGAGSATGLGFNVMPPPPGPQISRATAATGIGNNIAKRKYPTPPPPRVSSGAGQIEPSGGGWEGRLLVLGGKAGNGEEKKESGVGVKDGPWCREAFDLFGEWVRPVG